MNQNPEKKYKQVVLNKFQIYNSLFTSLPYDKMANVGMLIPLLYEKAKFSLERSENPVMIIDDFFDKHTQYSTEKERIKMLFIFIQYIERQVVLFDSIEDASFSHIHPEGKKGRLYPLHQLASQKENLKQLKEKFEDFGIRVVFTAHPTQFYPTEIQLIIEDLRKALEKNSIPSIEMLLKQLGRTSFIKKQKPTPVDEAKSIMHYLRYVYYPAIGELSLKIRELFFSQEEFIPENIIQLGFWPGGDRDGNPFVTAKTTKEVADELRRNILKCYYKQLKKIKRRLSYRGVIEPLNRISDSIYQNMFSDSCTISKEELLDELYHVKEVLNRDHNGLFRGQLNQLIQQIRIFGLYFARLDIRQDSRVHTRVLDQIIKVISNNDKPYSKWDYAEKLAFHKKEIHEPLDANQFDCPLVIDTIKNIQQLRSIQKINGEKSVHRYIISNCNNAIDLLNVILLFRLSGWKTDEITLDIVPLFETIEGMKNAEKTMRTMYGNDFYINHLKNRNYTQTIMLGFSDGTKDGGYVRANWDIFKTKEVLTRISKENEIDVIFFDGRGGPPARGGGKTHQFYASQGKTISNKEIQLTIQGQTITSTFGTIDQSIYNFEQLLSAGIMNDCFDSYYKELSEKERRLIDQMALISQKKYQELKDHELFIPYLENISTLKYYGRTNIGSRPSKRNKTDELRLEDLRAIPFVGAWSQLKQNIPGFYGFGTAIQELKDANLLEDIKSLYQNSKFFKTLLLNSMMSMQKTYFPLTYYMKRDPVYGCFWNLLHEEFLLAKSNMLEITGYSILMEEEPISRLSVQTREKIVLPLLCIQQYALERIKENDANKAVYEKMVTRSLFGNINASRNSA